MIDAYYYKHKMMKDGFLNLCINCFNKQIKEYAKNNPNKIKERNRKRYLNNKEEILAKQKIYYQENKERHSKQAKEYRERTKDKTIERRINYKLKNPDKIKESNRRYYHEGGGKERNKRYRENNIEKRREYQNEYCKTWLKNNITKNISHNMAVYINRSLKGKKNGAKWESLVGYSLNELMNHLESKFKSGMNWENRDQWHIDHIRPIASFNFTSIDDPNFKRCWALTNLQPLWAIDNMSKGAKMVVNF